MRGLRLSASKWQLVVPRESVRERALVHGSRLCASKGRDFYEWECGVRTLPGKGMGMSVVRLCPRVAVGS